MKGQEQKRMIKIWKSGLQTFFGKLIEGWKFAFECIYQKRRQTLDNENKIDIKLFIESSKSAVKKIMGSIAIVEEMKEPLNKSAEIWQREKYCSTEAVVKDGVCKSLSNKKSWSCQEQKDIKIQLINDKI